jgi:hypothetical protein
MRPRPSPFEKPTKLDYVVLVLGPLLFLTIAVLGIRSLLGIGGGPHPVERLRNGEVRAGMSEPQVLALLGSPRLVVNNEDGTYILRYDRSEWNARDKTFTQVDADVRFDANGVVSGVAFDSATPAPPK